MPGRRFSFNNESLWQTPHAATRTRAHPAGGSGTSRSTISSGPPGRVTCTARIFGMPYCRTELSREAADSLVLVVEHLEDGVEARQLHQAFAGGIQVHQLEPAAAVFECGVRAHQLAEAAGIDVMDLLHVEQHPELALVHQRVDGFPERGGRIAQNQAADECQHDNALNLPVDEHQRLTRLAHRLIVSNQCIRSLSCPRSRESAWCRSFAPRSPRPPFAPAKRFIAGVSARSRSR